MNVAALQDLVGQWHAEAETLRRRGAPTHGDALDSCAEDLELRLQEWLHEPLELTEAAHESGYSYSTLQSKVASGELPNAGEKGSPRIRRCDLPQKGGSAPLTLDDGSPDLAGEVLSGRL